MKTVKGKKVKATRVVRTGRTGDLQRRSADLARQFRGYGYRFKVDKVISHPDGRRIRDQYIHEQHPKAKENKIRGISPSNKNLPKDIEAGRKQKLIPKRWSPTFR